MSRYRGVELDFGCYGRPSTPVEHDFASSRSGGAGRLIRPRVPVVADTKSKSVTKQKKQKPDRRGKTKKK